MSKTVVMSMDFGHYGVLPVGEISSDGPVSAISLSSKVIPWKIPGLRAEIFDVCKKPFWLADVLPDAWGEKVMLHEMEKAGLSVRNVTVADKLAYIGNSGLGCWQFKPEMGLSQDIEKISDLGWLREQVFRLMAEKDCNLDWMKGSLSLGGARPKVFADIDENGRLSLDRLAKDREWILKIPGVKDGADAGKWEVVYGWLGREYGLPVQTCRLVQNDFFATRRFDFVNGERFLLRTVSSLNEASHADSRRNSYESILEHMGQLCGHYETAKEIAKLALFNHLMVNLDDHGKNVSFLMDGKGRWKLAPFYDLTYDTALGSHAMSINNTTTPVREDFEEAFNVFGIRREDITRETVLLTEIIRGSWNDLVSKAGIDNNFAARRKGEILEGITEFNPSVYRQKCSVSVVGISTANSKKSPNQNLSKAFAPEIT